MSSCQTNRLLPDYLTLTHLKHQLTAPINDHPTSEVHNTGEGTAYSDQYPMSYSEYAISKGLDPNNPLTIIRTRNTVESDRVHNELNTIEPEIQHLTKRAKELDEEHTTAKAEYRTKTRDGIYPLEPSEKKKPIIPVFMHRLRRQVQTRWLQYTGLGIISLIEGTSFLPAILSQYSLDPSNLRYALATAFPVVIMAMAFTLTISICLYVLGKEVVSRVHHFITHIRTGDRKERIITGMAMMIWGTMYFLFITALSSLRSSFSQDVMAVNEHAPETSLSFLYYVITATIPIVCGLLSSRIKPIDPAQINHVQSWENDLDETSQTQTKNLQRKHHHEVYLALLQNEITATTETLNRIQARKNTLLDRAQEAEEQLRKAFLQERTATITSARKGALDLHTAKLDYQRQHIARAEAERHQARNHQQQTSMARIIELAKAHS